MRTVVRNYDTLFNEIFNNVQSTNNFTPSANVKEGDESYKIEMSIPGFKKDDFKIEVNDRVLSVSSEIDQNTEEINGGYIRKEFSVNSFERTFRLPKSVESEQIVATYENGILTLNLPKKEEAKPKEPRLISIN